MKTNNGPQKLKDIIKKGQSPKGTGQVKKPPAYQWQDLALRVIDELGIPNKKRSAVFKACKENPKSFIETCLNDTKELCKTGEKWKYFFKLIGKKD